MMSNSQRLSTSRRSALVAIVPKFSIATQDSGSNSTVAGSHQPHLNSSNQSNCSTRAASFA